jgi:hypothetical protein
MTTKSDILAGGAGAQAPASVYRRGVNRKRLSFARKVDHIRGGVDTQQDMVRIANGINGFWPGDPFLPLQTVTVTRMPGGNAWRVSDYHQSGSRYNPNGSATLRADVNPKVVSELWWAFPIGTTTVNTEFDPRDGQTKPRAWQRDIQVNHIMVPTILSANPLGAIDGMIGRINSNSFEIDGVTYLPYTLRMDAPDITHVKTDNTIEYRTLYHYIARADGWYRSYLTSATVAATRLKYEAVTFTAPPYRG